MDESTLKRKAAIAAYSQALAEALRDCPEVRDEDERAEFGQRIGWALQKAGVYFMKTYEPKALVERVVKGEDLLAQKQARAKKIAQERADRDKHIYEQTRDHAGQGGSIRCANRACPKPDSVQMAPPNFVRGDEAPWVALWCTACGHTWRIK